MVRETETDLWTADTTTATTATTTATTTTTTPTGTTDRIHIPEEARTRVASREVANPEDPPLKPKNSIPRSARLPFFLPPVATGN